MCPFKEYCCHGWAGAPSYYLELLDKVQKQISCRAVGSALVASLELLAHWRNWTSLSLFYRYYFGRCTSELPQWFHFLIVKGGLLVVLTECTIFLSPFLNVTRMSMSTVSFVAELDSGILCLKNLTYDLNGFEDCVRNIFASLFCMAEREHFRNKKKCFLFHFESSFSSQDNQILIFQIFKYHDIKCPSMKHETHFTEYLGK